MAEKKKTKPSTKNTTKATPKKAEVKPAETKASFDFNRLAVKIPEDRLPPQSIEAEQSVLGAVMIDKNAILRVGDFLRPESFYRRSHQLIFNAMLELFGKQEAIDLLSVSSKLEEKKQLNDVGGRSYLANLVNAVPTSSHIGSYAKIVSKKKI